MKSKLGVALSVCLFAGLAQAQRLEFTNPDEMSTPESYTHVVRAGNLLFISGQTARTADGQILDVGMKEQLEQVMINLTTALQSQGADITSVAKITTYVTSMHEYRKPEVAAARPPLSMVSACSRPGSRRCVCRSIRPGATTSPEASRICASGAWMFFPIAATRPCRTSRSALPSIACEGSTMRPF